MKFSHLKISRKCWSGETKKISGCEADVLMHSRAQHFSFSTRMFRTGYRDTPFYHHSWVPGTPQETSFIMWWSMSKTGTVAEKSPLLGKVHSFLRRDTQQLTHVLTILQSVFKLTPPKTKHETWKRPVGKGTIFTKPPIFGVPALGFLGYVMKIIFSVSFYGGSVRRRCFFPARTNNDLLRITGKLWPSNLHRVYIEYFSCCVSAILGLKLLLIDLRETYSPKQTG